jgi:signal recognition particle receptor subunit beta
VSIKYYRGSDLCINRRSFERVDFWKNELIRGGVEDPDQFPFVVFANKSDLINVSGTIGIEEAKSAAALNHAPLFEVSAKTGDGIQTAFQKSVELLLDYNRRKVNRIPIGLQVTTEATRQNFCCG